MKKLFGLAAMLVVMALVVAGCGGGQTPASTDKKEDAPKEGTGEKLKVAYIYVGPVGDAGWTYAHDQGRQYLEKELPNIETSFVESVPETPADAERVLTDLVNKGNKVIFATSFGYMDSVLKVAKKYPDVIFLHCSGYKTDKNVGTYFGRMYQPRFLSGMAAGKQTKSNTIGFVAAMPIPEVVWGINSFTLGVKSVNPTAKVKVVWTNTWYDPAKEKDAAKSLLDAGADVIAMHQDTPGPMQAAEEKGAFSVGYNTDMRQFAPKAVLTGPVWNWGPYYVNTVKAVIDGTWKSEQYFGSMADGIIDLAPYGDMVSEDVRKLVDEKKQAILDGKFEVFAGPIKDQSGAVKVPEGKTMTDEEVLNMMWFVEGVDGSIPKK
ncbi:MAG: BMP family ABC transporter substrate-binding protein [Clostridia bacterium]|nr:BMP family ABC transporter substrate-binding protein [Clostridia bacterium]